MESIIIKLWYLLWCCTILNTYGALSFIAHDQKINKCGKLIRNKKFYFVLFHVGMKHRFWICWVLELGLDLICKHCHKDLLKYTSRGGVIFRKHWPNEKSCICENLWCTDWYHENHENTVKKRQSSKKINKKYSK